MIEQSNLDSEVLYVIWLRLAYPQLAPARRYVQSIYYTTPVVPRAFTDARVLQNPRTNGTYHRNY